MWQYILQCNNYTNGLNSRQSSKCYYHVYPYPQHRVTTRQSSTELKLNWLTTCSWKIIICFEFTNSGFVKPFISFDYINIYLQLDFLMRCCTMYINMRRSKSCFVLSQTNRINLLFFLHLFIDYNWTIYSWHQIDGSQISLVKKTRHVTP